MGFRLKDFGRLCPYRGRYEALLAGAGRRKNFLIKKVQW